MNTALKRIRVLCAVIFVAGIAGIIVTSIVSNNNGGIISIGLITSLAALVLITASTIATNKRIDAFDDVAAEHLEQQVIALVATGANEDAVRAVVRSAIDLGRSVS
ncbi:MAG: hypothetical protein D4R95_06810 [Actinobacteria bacterium]|nr:MAG: hypothetical protein D4R95_06810 [Actinomycetota bacterium]